MRDGEKKGEIYIEKEEDRGEKEGDTKD